jgi:chemotaxis protein methyltransferase CheR
VSPGMSEPLLAQVSELVAANLGLHFPRERWRDLARGLKAAAPELGFTQAPACAQWLVSSPVSRDQMEILAGHLIVPETYFFREPRTMEILEQEILPDLIRSRQGSRPRLRIWSAGCSTGEEPYSVAILLQRLLSNLKDWEITLLATDISHRSLEKCMAGVYTRWSFRGSGPDFRGKYFRKIRDGHYAINPEIKEMVTFSCLNLATDPYPSLWDHTAAMDLIICRNVLMYFTPEVARRVVGNLYRCLVDGGWLLVSAAESSLMGSVPVVSVNFPGGIFYRKGGEELPVQAEKDSLPLWSAPAEIPAWLQVDKEAEATPPEPDFVPLPTPLPIPQATEERRGDRGEASPDEEASTLCRRGRYADAETKLLERLTSDPGDVEAMTLMARTCANQGILGEALEWGEKAVATDKLSPGSHYLMATVLQEQGKVAEAAAALKRALYLDQNFVLAHFTLGHLALAQKRTQESRRHFATVLSLLEALGQDDLLPESEGMTAGRLKEMVASMSCID